MYTPPRCVTRTRRFLEVLGGGGASGRTRLGGVGGERTASRRFPKKGVHRRPRRCGASAARRVPRARGFPRTDARVRFRTPSAALAVARDEQRTTAALPADPARRRKKADASRRLARVAVAARRRASLRRARGARAERVLVPVAGRPVRRAVGAPNASNASNASNALMLSLFGSMDWLGGLEDALGVSSNAAARNGSGFPATAATAATEQPTAPRARAAPWWRPTGPSSRSTRVRRVLVLQRARVGPRCPPRRPRTRRTRTAPRWRRSRTTPFCTTRFCPSSGPRCITTATDPVLATRARVVLRGSRRVVSARHEGE